MNQSLVIISLIIVVIIIISQALGLARADRLGEAETCAERAVAALAGDGSDSAPAVLSAIGLLAEVIAPCPLPN